MVYLKILHLSDFLGQGYSSSIWEKDPLRAYGKVPESLFEVCVCVCTRACVHMSVCVCMCVCVHVCVLLLIRNSNSKCFCGSTLLQKSQNKFGFFSRFENFLVFVLFCLLFISNPSQS